MSQTKIDISNLADSVVSALSVPKITALYYPGDDTAIDPAGGQTINLTGVGFLPGCQVLVGNTYASVVSVISGTALSFVAPANLAGTYTLYTINSDGGTAIYVPGLTYSTAPVFSTPSGTLGTQYETTSFSTTIAATGDSGITYSIQSGSLPSGITLNSANGLISGTLATLNNSTTYTFTVRATDAEKQDTDRTFSITVNPDVVTFNSPAEGTTYSNATGDIFSLTLNASSAMGKSISYSANVLPTGLSISGSSITGTFSAAGNSSSLITATAATTNKTATRTLNWAITSSVVPGPTAMWLYGGNSSSDIRSFVDRITFATDTAMSSQRTSLTYARSRPGAAGNNTYGWVGGGEIFTNGPSSVVERVTYTSDTSAYSTRGPLSLSLRHHAATGNSDYGWYGAGTTPGGNTSSLTRITYSNDTPTSTTRGSLTAARYYYYTGTDKTNYGYWNDGSATTNMQRLNYASDSVTASVVAYFPSRSLYIRTFSGTTTYGWWAIGTDVNSNMISTIIRLTFSNNTVASRGNLQFARYRAFGGANDLYGYYAGGEDTSGVTFTSVERLDFSTDTAATSIRGPLSRERKLGDSTSGYQ